MVQPSGRRPVARHNALDGVKIADLSPWLTDFAETAAAVSQLDLVISVDTSVAHSAGALGQPVWIMLPYWPDWRWLLDQLDLLMALAGVYPFLAPTQPRSRPLVEAQMKRKIASLRSRVTI
jgi:hypothetical protein